MKIKLNEIITIVLSVISIIISIIVLVSDNIQAEKTLRMEKALQPIVYTINPTKDSKYTYNISGYKKDINIPAKSTEIKIQSGDIKSISLLTLNNNKINIFESFDFYSIKSNYKEKDSDYIISFDVKPAEEPIIDGHHLYDVFFIYIEALNGEKKLDLICYDINLETEKIENIHHYEQLDLLKLNSQEGITNQLLSIYEKLMIKIDSINNLL